MRANDAARARRRAAAAAQRRRRAALAEAARQEQAAREAAELAAQQEADLDAQRRANAEHMRNVRAAQEQEEREAERRENAEQHRARRAAEEAAQQEARRQAEAERLRQLRAADRRAPPSLAARRPAAVLDGTQDVAADNIGGMDRACAMCGARRWAAESATLCCGGGKIHLDPLPAPPPELRQLWVDATPEGATFRKFARHLNSALALASLTVREPPPPPGGHYAPSVIIQGRMYQRLGAVQAHPGQDPTFAQIYVHDPQAEDPAAEAAIRLGHVRLPANTSIPVQQRLRDLLIRLQHTLRQRNPYVQDIIMASEVLAEEVEHRQLVISAAARPVGEHERRYNAPEGFHEVAVLMGDQPARHDLVLRRRPVPGAADNLQLICETHRASDPLHFVLLFPLGTDGWHPELRQVAGPRAVTALQYYCYRIQVSAPSSM